MAAVEEARDVDPLLDRPEHRPHVIVDEVRAAVHVDRTERLVAAVVLVAGLVTEIVELRAVAGVLEHGDVARL